MGHADVGKQLRTRKAVAASTARQAAVKRTFEATRSTGGKAARLRRQRAEAARLRALTDAAAKEQTAAARLSDAFTPAIPTGLAGGERLAAQRGFVPPPVQPAVPPGVARAQPGGFIPEGSLLRSILGTPEQGALPTNLARFVEPRFGQPGGARDPLQTLLSTSVFQRRQPEGALPPNLARFVEGGGTPFTNLAERRQPAGVLPPNLAQSVARGGPTNPFGFGLSAQSQQAPGVPPPTPVSATSANANYDPNGGGGAAYPNAQNLFLAWRDPATFDRPPILFDEDFLVMNPELRDAMAGIEGATLTEFMEAMGYSAVPGTDKWIRNSVTVIPGTGSAGSRSFSRAVTQATRGAGTQPVSRGRVTAMGLTNWRIG